MQKYGQKVFLMTPHEIPKDHPRYESLRTREAIIEGMHKNIVAEAGLIAHGRGEAFDYLLGEATPDFALRQETLAVIELLEAEKPVISVNGNVAVLCPNELVTLGKEINALLEINLFYRTKERELAIKKVLEKAGAEQVLGVDPELQETIPELSHLRRIVDSRGIAQSDCIFVPLEDGDRTMALRKLGKKVVTVDLNPLSRTSLAATVSVTNNITRAVNEMIQIAREMKNHSQDHLRTLKESLNNKELLQEALKFMADRLNKLANEESSLKI